MIIKCVVACMTTEGADFYFCKVKCTQEEYDDGVHYEVAEDGACIDGFERPMVTFDENDGVDWLFEHFVWASADVIDSEDSNDGLEDDEVDDDDEEDDDA